MTLTEHVARAISDEITSQENMNNDNTLEAFRLNINSIANKAIAAYESYEAKCPDCGSKREWKRTSSGYLYGVQFHLGSCTAIKEPIICDHNTPVGQPCHRCEERDYGNDR